MKILAQNISDPLALLATPLSIGGVVLANRVFAAPMSGVSDYAFRVRSIAHGAGMAVAEMTAASRIGDDSGRGHLRRAFPEGSPRVVQLAGRDPALMAEAARLCEGEGAQIIDINFGCPAKKVTGGYAGSALMREPELVAALVSAVASAVSVPVTAKMRLGWDDGQLNAARIAGLAVEAGARMITVHGRTRCQFYSGKADWAAIAAVRDAVKVPLVVNGDIASAHDAAEALRQSGADAVMVGRGSYGAPWVPGQIAAAAGDTSAGRDVPQGRAAITRYVIAHHADMLSLYGVEHGMRHARKHLGWYLDRFAPGLPAADRTEILTSTAPESVHDALWREFHGAGEQAEAA